MAAFAKKTALAEKEEPTPAPKKEEAATKATKPTGGNDAIWDFARKVYALALTKKVETENDEVQRNALIEEAKRLGVA